jgi:hypothetical protein
MSEPERPRIFTLSIYPLDGQKALPSNPIISDVLLELEATRVGQAALVALITKWHKCLRWTVKCLGSPTSNSRHILSQVTLELGDASLNLSKAAAHGNAISAKCSIAPMTRCRLVGSP